MAHIIQQTMTHVIYGHWLINRIGERIGKVLLWLSLSKSYYISIIFGITDKNSFTAYVILYELIDIWFLDSNRRVGVWSLPWRWHILSIPLTTGRGAIAETCGLNDVFPPDDLGSRPEALC